MPKPSTQRKKKSSKTLSAVRRFSGPTYLLIVVLVIALVGVVWAVLDTRAQHRRMVFVEEARNTAEIYFDALNGCNLDVARKYDIRLYKGSPKYKRIKRECQPGEIDYAFLRAGEPTDFNKLDKSARVVTLVYGLRHGDKEATIYVFMVKRPSVGWQISQFTYSVPVKPGTYNFGD